MFNFLFQSNSTPSFDEDKWEKAIQNPDWYLRLLPDYKRLIKKLEKSDKATKDNFKEKVYNFFEKHLAQKSIVLGTTGTNWDSERRPVDTIVIHHTKNSPGITWQRLNAMQLLRIYAIYYSSPTEAERQIKGKPIYSNHFRNDQQVFYTYHWLVRMDGSIERLLDDHQIGWQAGNWDVNCRSIGICLDNDFESSTPSEGVLNSVGKLIKQYYPDIKPDKILGHREVNSKTTCPGNVFLTSWKSVLLSKIK